jgi:hypothetical protein
VHAAHAKGGRHTCQFSSLNENPIFSTQFDNCGAAAMRAQQIVGA